MPTLIYSECPTSMVGLPDSVVENVAVPMRRYSATNNFMEVAGANDATTAYDVKLILALPGYRLATIEECNQFYKKRRKAASITEAIPKQSNGG